MLPKFNAYDDYADQHCDILGDYFNIFNNIGSSVDRTKVAKEYVQTE
jgi:hypothetical protein